MIQFRYFYYIVAVNMLCSALLFAPQILLRERFAGAVLGIVSGVLIGTLLLALTVYALHRFPGQSLPEILQTSLPQSVRLVLLTYLILMWLLAGAVTLVSMSEITHLLLLPETPRLLIVLLFSVLALLMIRMQTAPLLSGMEMVFWITAPLLMLLLGKSVFEPTLSWRAMLEVGTHLNNVPSLGSLSVSTLLFTGCLNLVILNRTIQGRLQKVGLGAIAVVGMLTLLLTFFIPIGMLGTYAAAESAFPWGDIAGSLQMEFLILFLMIAFLSVILHWHVGYAIAKETFAYQRPRSSWLMLGAVASGVVIMHLLVQEEEQLFEFTYDWLIVRFFSEIVLVFTLLYVARRHRQT